MEGSQSMGMVKSKDPVGIDSMVVVSPQYYVDCEELAQHRDIPKDKISDGLGCHTFSVPYGESITDLAVRALKEIGVEGIGRFYIATESNPDLSRSLATEILPRLGLNHVETRELRFACLGGMQALQDACQYTALTGRPGIVLCVDRSIYREGGSEEFTQGCSAVAMRVTREPALLMMDFDGCGVWIGDVADFAIPAPVAPFPEVQGKLSTVAYLHAAKMAYDDWQGKHLDLVQSLDREGKTPLDHFDYFVFHTPFPKIARWAFCALYGYEKLGLPVLPIGDFLLAPELLGADRARRKEIERTEDFQRLCLSKVLPGLQYNPYIGNSYTGSIFVSLASVLEKVKRNQLIGLLGYGSGAGAMFSQAISSCDGHSSGLKEQLTKRQKLSVAEYNSWREQTKLAFL